MPEPATLREKARVLTEGRGADKFMSALKRSEKGEGLGVAFLSPFLFATEKKGVGVRG
jgi:hypothetical protein